MIKLQRDAASSVAPRTHHILIFWMSTEPLFSMFLLSSMRLNFKHALTIRVSAGVMPDVEVTIEQITRRTMAV